MLQRLCAACAVALMASTALAGDFQVAGGDVAARAAEQVAPPTYYGQHLARYRELQTKGVPDADHYAIPQGTITRDTYMQWLEANGEMKWADDPTNHGQAGPMCLLGALAKYVQTKDPKWGNACLAMLHAYDKWVRDEVKRNGWHSQFIVEPRFLGLYRKYLTEGGAEDLTTAPWFRELVLFHTRNLHVWGGAKTYWRGPMYRAQSEGNTKALAVKWYPDIPEAKEWQQYATLVHNDWWAHKDILPDDTGYFFGNLHIQFLGAYLLGDDDFFTNPEMKRVWDRLVYEMSPDGEIIPYGPNSGWDSAASERIWLLELLASKTRDGRYRWAAHKLMNYLLYQQPEYFKHHQLKLTEPMALAYLFADDSVKPVAPEGGSRILYRKEIVWPRNKQAAAKLLGPLDPAPDRADICCGMAFNGKEVPSKLALRSGWEPGDFFALVDLFPSGQAPGILGMTRWGAGLGFGMDSKGGSYDGRLQIDDLGGSAPLRRNTNPDIGDELIQETAVPVFADLKRATFATAVVTNYDGFPVKYTRDFLFIKNRFLVARDTALFEEGFLARVASLYNTQNVGPQVGPTWANTFFDELRAANFPQPIKNPPYDLLVYFTPQAECRLQVVDRTVADPRAYDLPAQLRYVWRGLTQAGQRVHFTQVYYPHPPGLELPRSNNPGAVRAQDLMGTAGADAIHVLQDTPDLTVLQFAFDPDRVEWVVSNPGGVAVSQGGLGTDARYLYVDTVKGEVKSVSAVGATYLSLEGKDVFRQGERGTVER